MTSFKRAPVLAAAVTALSLFAVACATKKHVREAIAPVQTEVDELKKTTAQHTQAIGDLDRNVSRADERAMEADKKAAAAGQSADRAGQAAAAAQQSADAATQSAQLAMNHADHAGLMAAAIASNLGNYQLVATEKAYFKVNRAELSKEDQAKLDAALQQARDKKNLVIEVEGFADSTGRKAANIELARRRSEAVVRYLALDQNIPLRAIHNVGVGSDFPNSDNSTREKRKENRRVDVKIYALDMSAALAK